MARSELKNVLSHGRLYGLANLVSRCSGLVLLPVYTHILAPEEYGLYASTVLVTDLVSVVLGMGLGRALIRFHVEQDQQSGKDAVLGTALVTFAAMAVIVALLAYPTAILATRLLFGSTETAWLFTWAIWALIPSTLFNIQLNHIVVLKQSLFYLAISVLKAVVFIALNLWIVVWLDQGVLGIVLSTLIASTIVVAVILARMIATTSMTVSRALFVDMVRFGGPLVPTIMLDTVMASLDRYVISPVQGPAALGQYGLGMRVASLLNLFVTSPFLQIWGVRQMEALQEGGDKRELPHVFFLFSLVLIMIAAAIGMFSGTIVHIIADEAYAPAATVLPWLAALQVIIALRNFAEVGLHHAKKTSPLMTIALISLAVALPAYWFAIQMGGIVGVAIAALVVMLLRTGMTIHTANRHSELIRLFAWGRLATAVMLGFGTVLLCTAWDGSLSLLQETVLKISGLLLLMAAFGLFLARTDGTREDVAVIPGAKDA